MRGSDNKVSQENVALIFSGGVALGSYLAGAYAAFHEQQTKRASWVAGSSIGAITAALIAGNRPDARVERLRALWKLSSGPGPRTDHVSPFQRWRHLENWTSAIQARLVGSAGQFRPRTPAPWEQFRSIYDLAPLRESITKLVDFDLLNNGELRFTVATTD